MPGIGQIGDHHVVRAPRRSPQPAEGVRGDDPHPRIPVRVLVQRGQRRVGARQPHDARVEFDDVDRRTPAVPQHLAHGEPVAAAEDQHAARAGRRIAGWTSASW